MMPVQEKEKLPDSQRIEREREFWDRHTNDSTEVLDIEDYRTGPDDRHDRSMPWLPYIGMPNYIERVLQELGDVTDKAVLDLGTGSGFLASLLACRGARVDAVDISGAALDLARLRADLSGVGDRVRLHNMPVDKLGFPDDSFDRIVGAFLLHHLDLPHCVAEMHRVLRPGGVAVFVETWGRNKLLMAARSTLTGRFGIEKAGSEDEAPIGRTARRILAEGPFSRIEFSFPDFLFFRMAGYLRWARIGPLPAVWRTLDLAAGSIPALRAFSYFAVVILRK